MSEISKDELTTRIIEAIQEEPPGCRDLTEKLVGGILQKLGERGRVIKTVRGHGTGYTVEPLDLRHWAEMLKLNFVGDGRLIPWLLNLAAALERYEAAVAELEADDAG